METAGVPVCATVMLEGVTVATCPATLGGVMRYVSLIGNETVLLRAHEEVLFSGHFFGAELYLWVGSELQNAQRFYF